MVFCNFVWFSLVSGCKSSVVLLYAVGTKRLLAQFCFSFLFFSFVFSCVVLPFLNRQVHILLTLTFHDVVTVESSRRVDSSIFN